ncbi:aspartate aminotransferase family protein [Desulfovibrio sp. OttesenSCG-928-C06]|nr:aspartate aminotransferase family protein [Desulfovibrio sp. OttesenSCG-928-C06]
MNSFNEVKERADKVLCKTYARYPIAVKSAKGSRLWDFEGREYIDLLTGIAVTSLGHSNEEVGAAICAQAQKFLHVSNLFYQEEQVYLAERLAATSHCGRAFFCNSGAEANEAMIKLARRYQQRVKGRDAYEIITFKQCFHGRTLATIATGQQKFQDGFLPMPEGFTSIEWNDLELLDRTISSKTAAVLIEMVQGEGGIRPATAEFAQGVQALCRKHGVMLLIDEIQSGMCRSGKWWSFQNFGLEPDAFSSAKALANGVPMGAMMCTEEASKGFDFGSHGTTFGGNALASAAACKTLEIMERDKLHDRAGELGRWALERFRQVAEKVPGTIREVRGMGLLIGIDLAFPGKDVWLALIERGFALNLTQDTVLRLLPALNIAKDDLEAFAVALEEVLKAR